MTMVMAEVAVAVIMRITATGIIAVAVIMGITATGTIAVPARRTIVVDIRTTAAVPTTDATNDLACLFDQSSRADAAIN